MAACETAFLSSAGSESGWVQDQALVTVPTYTEKSSWRLVLRERPAETDCVLKRRNAASFTISLSI